MDLPAMTIEEVASEENLRIAFQQVASNKGAPGPDRLSVEEVREHLDEILPTLRRELLDGSYRPGMIRRVWIQAAHEVLSPHYEPSFHASSHGFRRGRSCHTPHRTCASRSGP
jgi:RNA-directed DNA polymerase